MPGELLTWIGAALVAGGLAVYVWGTWQRRREHRPRARPKVEGELPRAANDDTGGSQ